MIHDGLLTMLDDINIQVATNNGNSDGVCVLKTSLVDLVFTFRRMFVCRHRNDEKTVIKIVIHLQIYATMYQLLTAECRRDLRWLLN